MKLTPEETKQLRESLRLYFRSLVGYQYDVNNSSLSNEEKTQSVFNEIELYEQGEFISHINTLLEEREKGLVEKIEHKSQFFLYSIPHPDEGKWKVQDDTARETKEQILNIIKNQ